MIEGKKLDDVQQAYLGAMGIPVWSSREASVAEPVAAKPEPFLKLGPGSGGILLICTIDTESASKLANDICRAMASVPVWSWPDNGTDAVIPAAAVEEKLFTTVAVFGEALTEQVFGNPPPQNVAAANLVVFPAMQDLETSADARQELWAELCRSGMVAKN